MIYLVSYEVLVLLRKKKVLEDPILATVIRSALVFCRNARKCQYLSVLLTDTWHFTDEPKCHLGTVFNKALKSAKTVDY